MKPRSAWRQRATLGTCAWLLAVLSAPAISHHSYAMFDRTKTVTVSGTVRTFQWTNPHVYLWIIVSEPQTIYAFEFGGGPNGLSRSGWNIHTLNSGDKISVTYNPLKDGRTGGGFVSVVLPDGTKMDSNGVISATSQSAGPADPHPGPGP